MNINLPVPPVRGNAPPRARAKTDGGAEFAIGKSKSFSGAPRGLPKTREDSQFAARFTPFIVSPPPNTPAALSREIDLVAREDHLRWFAEEVQPHEPGLRNWLRRRFPWLTDIDDLVQESYARILRARSEGRVGHAKSYLFTTARNAAHDQARRNQIISFESVADMGSLPVLEDRPDAAERLTRTEELEILAAAIESLPQRCRLVVKLRKLRGLSYEEIAAQLGISAHTVNAQLVKGITLCREYLRQHGVEHDET